MTAIVNLKRSWWFTMVGRVILVLAVVSVFAVLVIAAVEAGRHL